MSVYLSTHGGKVEGGSTSHSPMPTRMATCMLFTLIAMPAMLFFPAEALRQIALAETDATGADQGEEFLYLGMFLLSKSAVHWIARTCLYVGGFGAIAPKTLLGVVVRDCVPDVISGTCGGLLGLFGNIGCFVGGLGVTYFLSSSSNPSLDHGITHSNWRLFPAIYTMVTIALLVFQVGPAINERFQQLQISPGASPNSDAVDASSSHAKATDGGAQSVTIEKKKDN